jgi:ABC-type glycerol-3-phosphate transport system substrate-binding protein
MTMTRVMMMLAALTLAACGADGAPSAEPGLTVSGEAQVGVVVNPDLVEGQ